MHASPRALSALCALFLSALLLTTSITAQELASSSSAPEPVAALPDSPGTVFTGQEQQNPAPITRRPHTSPRDNTMVAPVTHKLILPGEVAPRLTARDKVNLGLIQGASPFSMVSWIFAAGYEQVTDNTPNYGTDSGAYGQRLAAAAVRGYSEEVIGTSILAPLLHEDPRYYRIGPKHGYFYRTVYAMTRPIITRADDGHYRPNFSLVGGNLAGAALTNAYYPSLNRGFKETMDTFEGSMGGAAFSSMLDEYLGEILQVTHLKHFHE